MFEDSLVESSEDHPHPQPSLCGRNVILEAALVAVIILVHTLSGGAADALPQRR